MLIILSSISTKVPVKGKLDQSAFAVIWKNTFQPLSYFSPVIKGVPSSSVAHVFVIKSEDGSAITCFLIRISLSIFIPNKGDLLENVFIETGSVQLKAPPKALESTDLSFTGS